ncbi:hypothetical protein ACFLSQ_02580 [Bacteroidota bacterium]
MQNNFSNRILTVGIAAMILLIISSSCDTTPPVKPPPPDTMGCTVTGDVSVNYISKNGVMNKNSGPFQLDQFAFSSYANIDGESYDLWISIFFDELTEMPMTFPVVMRNDTMQYNQSWIAFVVGINSKNKMEFWADSGTVYIDSLILGVSRNYIKARFNCRAADTSSKEIVISEGWAEINRKF